MKNIKNYIILIPILILNIISIIYLYQTPYFYKHLLFLTISYTLLILFSRIKINYIIKYIKYLYVLSILLLFIVLIIGREINGSKAWIHLFNISFQPSELTKLILTLYCPYLAIRNKKILLLIIIIIPSILTYLEPDTGAIIFYFIILLTSLKYTKYTLKSLLPIILLIIIIISSHIYLYINYKNILINIYGNKLFYRLDRLLSFKNGTNIQNINSLISIGSHHLLYIPENHNDFIFASIISKYSITFVITQICYISILIFITKKLTNKNNISNIYTNTILNMLLFQIFYNILMNISLLPIIGIPLPFISYGGSYLITLYIEIGLLINLNSKKVRYNKDDNKDYSMD